MSEVGINATFQEDHERLDGLFAAFQQQKRSNLAQAKESFAAFKFGLRRHIVWEEDILFPKWEENSGENSGMAEGGPTRSCGRSTV